MYSKQAAAGVIVSFIILTFIVIISVTMMISYQSFVVDSQERLNEQQNEIVKTSQTAFQINNVTYNATREELLFRIENTGSVGIETEELSYFIDETYLLNITPTKIDDNSQQIELLEPFSQMQINHSITLGNGDHSLRVVQDSGILQIEIFTVP